MGEKHDDAIDTLDQARTVEFHDRYGNVSRVFSEEADLIHFDAELKAGQCVHSLDDDDDVYYVDVIQYCIYFSTRPDRQLSLSCNHVVGDRRQQSRHVRRTVQSQQL